LAGEYVGSVVGGHVLPPVPFFIRDRETKIISADGFANSTETVGKTDGESYEVQSIATELTTVGYSIMGVPMCFPITLKPQSWNDNRKWMLPTEPMITIGGGNKLTRRNVAKISNSGKARRGSIKERWSTDDYTINITGMLTKLDDWTYPKEDFKRLVEIAESREPIIVECDLLLYLGITRIVIEKYDFPFTKGEENQAYTISAYSDDDWDLFIKIDS
jgi:hypothetical protein